MHRRRAESVEEQPEEGMASGKIGLGTMARGKVGVGVGVGMIGVAMLGYQMMNIEASASLLCPCGALAPQPPDDVLELRLLASTPGASAPTEAACV